MDTQPNQGLQVPNDIQNEDDYGVAVTVNAPTDEETHGISIPSDVEYALWPRIRLTKLELVNFGKYEDVVIDLTHNGKPLPMACLVGPNGTGKTTILDAVTMLCSNFTGYDQQRFSDMMLRRVRNWMHLQDDFKIMSASFSVRGTFLATYPTGIVTPGCATSARTEEYVVEFTRHKFRFRHPQFIEERLPRYCFVARFDNELTIFQMRRKQWPLFQELFSSVTGFPIEEDVDMFHDTSDSRMKQIQDEYVLGFTVKKPKETIRHKMCSAGEKKIAKCFSTVLNATVPPSIIVVDNVLMHIEVGRHLPVMESLSKCFPNSQLIVACHSVPVSKCLPNRECLFDMRWTEIPGLVWREPWRLRLMDDINEAMERLVNLPMDNYDAQHQDGIVQFMSHGKSLLKLLEKNSDGRVLNLSLEWLSKFPLFLKDDLLGTSLPKMRWHDNRQLQG